MPASSGDKTGAGLFAFGKKSGRLSAIFLDILY
jgi:hypothetical protein